MKSFRLIFLILIFAGIYLYRVEIIQTIKPLINKIPLTQEAQKLIGLDDLATTNKKDVSLPGPLARLVGQNPLNTNELLYNKIIEATNNERIKYNLKPFTEKDLLNQSATFKALDMNTLQYFEHESPSGVDITDLAKKFNYQYVTIGENLAMGNFESEEAIVEAWMNSPGHRANILNPKYTQIGVGLIIGTWQNQKVLYAVQHFGKPLSDCPTIDKALKLIIEKNQLEVSKIQNLLNAQKIEIEKEGTHSKNYESLVQAYNDLVGTYNKLVEDTRARINTYNAQITAFNNCSQ